MINDTHHPSKTSADPERQPFAGNREVATPDRVPRSWRGNLPVALLLLAGALILPHSAAADETEAQPIKVVATTTIVGDVVSLIGGEQINLETLLTPDADPHGFRPTPRDAMKVADADIVFANGLGLEDFLDDLLKRSRRRNQEPPPVVELGGKGRDPHVWTDPYNVMAWADKIASTLAGMSPDHADTFNARAREYRSQLEELDGWIRREINGIPQDRRRMVTDHNCFEPFSERYNIPVAGMIIPGFHTLSEPSAAELAQLTRTIREQQVPAIFIGEHMNPDIAEQVAAETGINLVPIHTGSLTGPDGDAASYLNYMIANTTRIVEALKQPIPSNESEKDHDTGE